MIPRAQSAAALPAAALVLLGAACGASGGRPADDMDATDEPPVHARIDLPSIAACGPCHPRQYEEWAASLHHGAWTNANARAATHDFALEECRCCHSPLPVLPHSLTERPLFRTFVQDDGVHCLSCHGRDGGVAAARTVADAPCRPQADARLLQAELCQPCHEPTHQAFTEWRRSAACADGVRCADCHMPERADGSGRSHGPHGGFDAAFVQQALRWQCAIAGGELVVTLRNRTGHRFPGEIPSRSLLLRIDVSGREPIRELLRRPFKGEARADNRLEPDEERVLRYALGAEVAAADVSVRLLFLPLPLLAEEQAFVLGEWRGER